MRPRSIILALGVVAACASPRGPGAGGTEAPRPDRAVRYGELRAATPMDLDSGRGYEAALVGRGLFALAAPDPDLWARFPNGLASAVERRAVAPPILSALRARGYEYEVALDDGRRVSIIEVHDLPLETGARVSLLFGDGHVRIEES